jgi:hypothetical protein
MTTKLVYKRIWFNRSSPESIALDAGTYEPPNGWRVHSMSISETEYSYSGYIHLLLEATVDVSDKPYR